LPAISEKRSEEISAGTIAKEMAAMAAMAALVLKSFPKGPPSMLLFPEEVDAAD
jgi:hypothetical protein